MERKIFALAVGAVMLLATGAIVYALQNSNAEATDVNSFYDKMAEEHEEMLEAHRRLANGEITQEEFNELIAEHRQEMWELHQESGFGCPMMGGNGFYRGSGMMRGFGNGFGMMG
ncbi:hypothetical protein A3K63_04585 [Candidatus Micrarchaeota archaeon RBG_16_49_10]|nr:MAG: hypothetical protein A3K63_04585 [Candidatus Micrarchaeota archaeon RBG_16_49_10]